MPDTPQDRALGLTTAVVGKTYSTPLLTPPGIGTGAAYADLEALGLHFFFEVPRSGVIQSAIYYDLDDEGLQVDLWLLSDAPTTQTDNGALTFIDHDLIKVITRIQFMSFADAGNGQFAESKAIGKAYVQPSRRMWAQCQARGALNIAAGNLPQFRIDFLSDE